MSVDVVKSLSYEDSFMRGRRCTGVSSYATVPDMSDLRAKASSSELICLKNDLKGDIKDLNDELLQKLSELDTKVDTKVEELSNIVLSKERQEAELQVLNETGFDIINRISSECANHISTIRNEVDAFRRIDLQKEMNEVIDPIDKSLQTIDKKTSYLMHRINSVDELDRKIKYYEKLANEIKTDYGKFKSERKNIENAIKASYEEKIRILNFRIIFISIYIFLVYISSLIFTKVFITIILAFLVIPFFIFVYKGFIDSE